MTDVPRNPTQEQMDAYQLRLLEMIEKYGHAVQGVFGEDPSECFSYTVGLTTQGKPELLITGPLSMEIHRMILNDAARLDLEPGQRRSDLLEDYDVLVIAADPVLAEVSMARHFYADQVSLLQILWPDPEGLFPTEPGYQHDRFPQPVRGV